MPLASLNWPAWSSSSPSGSDGASSFSLSVPSCSLVVAVVELVPRPRAVRPPSLRTSSADVFARCRRRTSELRGLFGGFFEFRVWFAAGTLSSCLSLLAPLQRLRPQVLVQRLARVRGSAAAPFCASSWPFGDFTGAFVELADPAHRPFAARDRLPEPVGDLQGAFFGVARAFARAGRRRRRPGRGRCGSARRRSRRARAAGRGGSVRRVRRPSRCSVRSSLPVFFSGAVLFATCSGPITACTAGSSAILRCHLASWSSRCAFGHRPVFGRGDDDEGRFVARPDRFLDDVEVLAHVVAARQLLGARRAGLEADRRAGEDEDDAADHDGGEDRAAQGGVDEGHHRASGRSPRRCRSASG